MRGLKVTRRPDSAEEEARAVRSGQTPQRCDPHLFSDVGKRFSIGKAQRGGSLRTHGHGGPRGPRAAHSRRMG